LSPCSLTNITEQQAVDHFFTVALEAGGIDNGRPGIRNEMSRQPYYAAFVLDPDGNNLEAVHVKE
jgi:predicted lactoylglutathione lyase